MALNFNKKLLLDVFLMNCFAFKTTHFQKRTFFQKRALQPFQSIKKTLKLAFVYLPKTLKRFGFN